MPIGATKVTVINTAKKRLPPRLDNIPAPNRVRRAEASNIEFNGSWELLKVDAAIILLPCLSEGTNREGVFE